MSVVACSDSGGATPVAVQGLPELTEFVEADDPPVELPAELLVFEEAEREADRLLARTRRTQNLCAAMEQLAVIDEPAHDDLEELLGFAAQYFTTLQSIDPTAKVRDPDDPDERMELPDEVMENLASQEQGMFAYVVRLSYLDALVAADRLSPGELQPRMDAAFVELFHSDYTEADRALVAELPQYCQATT